MPFVYPAASTTPPLNATNTMTEGVGLSSGGQAVIYAMLAMLIFIFAAGIFSVVCPPPPDAENIEPFFSLDSFAPSPPGSPESVVEEKRAW
ncbi:hypothetical protein EUX98_g5188 [Antrodiella citrinella]|uniref:Transmembrane protein n=1 Tax=Antrodiella citrinella TaxID=2447956 RepID=A0A4S4MUY2_9APHY|nr:hypothetical protein EUX98_g5188 [Antrodiella citrinella]